MIKPKILCINISQILIQFFRQKIKIKMITHIAPFRLQWSSKDMKEVGIQMLNTDEAVM